MTTEILDNSPVEAPQGHYRSFTGNVPKEPILSQASIDADEKELSRLASEKYPPIGGMSTEVAFREIADLFSTTANDLLTQQVKLYKKSQRLMIGGLAALGASVLVVPSLGLITFPVGLATLGISTLYAHRYSRQAAAVVPDFLNRVQELRKVFMS